MSTVETPIEAVGVVNGFAEPGFERVADAFRENFESRGELGAAVCVYQDGRPVVDLWGGVAGSRPTSAWQEDTVGLIFSATKGLTAVCALMLVEQGRLDLDAPVSQYWPEFAAGGKESVLVRHLLTHQVGLLGFTRLMTMADMEAWHPLVEDLAAQTPRWEPGTAHGYHAYTFGWLVGEVVRRVSGLTPKAFLREHISKPLGLDMWMGLPVEERSRYAPVEQNFHREPADDLGYEFIWKELAEMSAPGALTPLGQRMNHALLRGRARPFIERAAAKNVTRRELSDTQAAFLTMLVTVDDMNTDRGLSLEFPAGNGVCTARSLARFYAALVGEVDGVRLLGPELVSDAARPQAEGVDRVYGAANAFGLGFMVPGGERLAAWPKGTFGHYGNGGATGFADPERRLALGYLPKRITPMSYPARAEALIKALDACV